VEKKRVLLHYKIMAALKNSELNLEIFYQKNDLPKISVGDKVRVTIYLELPKEVGEGEKKRKGKNPNV
jgi:hypothetical protein